MLLVKNIAKIVGVDESGRLRVKGRDMNVLGEIDNAWLLADGDRIAAYGTMDKMPEVAPDTEVVDAEGGMLSRNFRGRALRAGDGTYPRDYRNGYGLRRDQERLRSYDRG